MPPRPALLLSTLLVGGLLSGLLAGCGSDDGARDQRAGENRRSSQSPTQSSTSAATQAPESGAATPTSPQATPRTDAEKKERDQKMAPPTAPRARTDRSSKPGDHLLAAESLPRLGGGAAWEVRTTGPEHSRPVGACQKTPLVDIGAVTAVRRVFVGPEESGMRTRQVVAEFADAKSAWRAHEVLAAWRDDCEQRLQRRSDVGPMEDVDLEVRATGAHYRAVLGSRDRRRTTGFGIVRTGRWLSIVEIRATPSDYPARWSPSSRAVRRIADTFA